MIWPLKNIPAIIRRCWISESNGKVKIIGLSVKNRIAYIMTGSAQIWFAVEGRIKTGIFTPHQQKAPVLYYPNLQCTFHFRTWGERVHFGQVGIIGGPGFIGIDLIRRIRIASGICWFDHPVAKITVKILHIFTGKGGTWTCLPDILQVHDTLYKDRLRWAHPAW